MNRLSTIEPGSATPGELSQLIRQHDWSTTPLGAMAAWSPSLRTTVDLMLATQAQIVLFCGPQFVALYNDVYAPTIGEKHPRALGRPAQENWAELWDDLHPLLSGVMETGETFSAKDRPFYIERSGYGETVYFDISYSPVRNGDGTVEAVLCIVAETTDRVRATQILADNEERQPLLLKLSDALREVDDAVEIQSVAASTLGQHLGTNRVFYGEVSADGGQVLIQHDYFAGATSIAGLHTMSDYDNDVRAKWHRGEIVASDDVEADPNISAQQRAAFAAVNVRAWMGIPLIKAGRLVAILGLGQAESRHWSHREMSLVSEVAERTWSAVERAKSDARLRDSEKRFRALVSASSDVVYRMSPDWQEMRQLDGRGFLSDAEGPTVRWLDEYLFPEDQPTIMAEANRAMAARDTYELEHRVRQADGTEGWTFSRAIPIVDESGAITEWFGMATDVTHAKRIRDQQRLLNNELSHRIKNLFAMVQAISLQTLRPIKERGEVRTLQERLLALSSAHDILLRNNWIEASVIDVVTAALAALGASERVKVNGTDITIGSKAALSMALLLHELGTNALKYGALSAPQGSITLRWAIEARDEVQLFCLRWMESDGPPIEAPPAKGGFGTRLLSTGLTGTGGLTLDYKRDGLEATLASPLREMFWTN
ncbi:HWE histidine kinase domain-containing protein [Tardiphaga sp.]|uniref:HWE histidine kinase domain-containing protein n=1 Tax=Tardiphaga sp. TaxID=1926292 RepID=UPI0037DA3801